MSDVNILLKLANEMIREGEFTYQKKLMNESEEARWLESEIKKVKAKRKIFLIATRESRAVATAQIARSSGLTAHLGTLAIWVTPDFRGQGIGRKLLSALEEEAVKLGIQKIKLTVRSINKAAIALYEKTGYSVYGELPDGIMVNGKALDTLLMYKDIK